MRYCICIVLFVQSVCFSQIIVWEKNYGSFTNLYSNIESFDTLGNNYVLAVSQGNTALYYHRLMLVNALGDTVWTRHYADTIRSNYRCPVKVYENNIYYSPTNEKINSDSENVIMLKVSPEGIPKKLGEYKIKDLNKRATNGISLDVEGNLLFYGRGTNSNVPGTKGGGGKITVQRIDSEGKELFQTHFIQSDTLVMYTFLSSMAQYNNTNYLFYGAGQWPGDSRPFLMKVNANWDTIATKMYLKSDYGSNYSRYYEAYWGNMIVGEDGQFYICGAYSNNKPSSSHFFVAKVDTSLNLKWVREPGKIVGNKGLSGSRIQQLPDGNLLLVGADAGLGSIAMYKLDTAGNFLDSARVSSSVGAKLQQINDMKYYPKDNSLVFAGAIDTKAYLAKINMGKLVTGIEHEASQEQSIFSLSPNPSSGQLTVNSYQPGNLEVYDTKGQLVKTFQVQNTDQPLDVRELLTGVYLYRFSTEGGVKYGKLIKQ